MAVLNYEVSADELNNDFVQVVKTLFKGKKVRISIREGAIASELPFEGSLAEKIEASKKTHYAYQLSSEELSSLVNESLADENFDIVAAIERYKVAKK